MNNWLLWLVNRKTLERGPTYKLKILTTTIASGSQWARECRRLHLQGSLFFFKAIQPSDVGHDTEAAQSAVAVATQSRGAAAVSGESSTVCSMNSI